MNIVKILNKIYTEDDMKIGTIFSDISDLCNIEYTDSILYGGSYGYVRKGKKYSNNVAIKVYSNDIFNYDFLSEIGLLYILQGIGLYPELLDIILTFDGNYVAIVMTDKGDIVKKSLALEYLILPDINNIVCDFISSYTYLYKNGIIHRDIKYNNICIDGYVLSIIDFGYAIRSPFCSNSYDIISINRNVDFDIHNNKNHTNDFVRTLDYMSIFNTIYQLYGGNISQNDFSSEVIVKRRLHFLLTRNPKNRAKIISFLKKKNNMDYKLLSNDNYYESCQQESWIFDYAKVKENSGKMFELMKKLININPKTRPTVNQILKQTESIFNTKIYQTLKHEQNISYETLILFYKFPEKIYFAEDFDYDLPLEVYSQTYFRIMQLSDINPYFTYQKLYYTIKHIYQSTSYDNIIPYNVTSHDIIKIIEFTNGNLFDNNPYKYYNSMWLINKNKINKIVFGYFMIVFSQCYLLKKFTPYYICLLISFIISRINHKYDLNPYVIFTLHDVPSKYFFNIPLSKSTHKLLIKENRFMSTVNSLFSYYRKMIELRQLDVLNKYMTSNYHGFNRILHFYKKYMDKYIKKSQI